MALIATDWKKLQTLIRTETEALGVKIVDAVGKKIDSLIIETDGYLKRTEAWR
ncbi:MAG: hypothetical protein HYZ09_02880 [Candidatus Kerfeldbacteria bacterium]|nr:hypothetical protein [Candidatus Kerfeldbacteria bacterium]